MHCTEHYVVERYKHQGINTNLFIPTPSSHFIHSFIHIIVLLLGISTEYITPYATITTTQPAVFPTQQILHGLLFCRLLK